MSLANRIVAGDSLEFGVDVPAYLPAAGWTFKQRLVPRFSSPAQTPITLTGATGSTVDGTPYDYVITATPVTTAAWAAGAYGWHSWVEKSGARVTLQGTQFEGELTVLPDPALITQGTDTRSQARKAYDDALAARASFAAGGNAAIAEYQIGDRRMKFKNPAELDQLINQLARAVADEKRAAAIAAGRPDPRKVFVRAGRA